MKVERTVSSSKDLLKLEVVELLGLLASMTVTEECDSLTMVIQRLGSNQGDFEFKIECSKIDENKSHGFFSKLRRML